VILSDYAFPFDINVSIGAREHSQIRTAAIEMNDFAGNQLCLHNS
jgi:hypothetical protein